MSFEGTWYGMEEIWQLYRHSQTPYIPDQGFVEFKEDGVIIEIAEDRSKIQRSRPLRSKLEPYSLPLSDATFFKGDRLITTEFTSSQFVPYDVRTSKLTK